MIRLRVVGAVAVVVLLVAAWVSFAAYGRQARDTSGATGAAHVAATQAILATLPTPTGSRPDRDAAGCKAPTSCWTSTGQQPETLVSTVQATLLSKGSTLRSHHCWTSDAATQRLTGEATACQAVLDYRGARVAVTATSSEGGRTVLRVDAAQA